MSLSCSPGSMIGGNGRYEVRSTVPCRQPTKPARADCGRYSDDNAGVLTRRPAGDGSPPRPAADADTGVTGGRPGDRVGSRPVVTAASLGAVPPAIFRSRCCHDQLNPLG